jgi:hypothetical protein
VNNIDYFWEVPDFWKILLVLALIAAMATLAICFGPKEAPYEDDTIQIDPSDVAVKTQWGISTDEWNALTDDGRAYYRENVSHAIETTRTNNK